MSPGMLWDKTADPHSENLYEGPPPDVHRAVGNMDMIHMIIVMILVNVHVHINAIKIIHNIRTNGS